MNNSFRFILLIAVLFCSYISQHVYSEQIENNFDVSPQLIQILKTSSLSSQSQINIVKPSEQSNIQLDNQIDTTLPLQSSQLIQHSQISGIPSQKRHSFKLLGEEEEGGEEGGEEAEEEPKSLTPVIIILSVVFAILIIILIIAVATEVHEWVCAMIVKRRVENHVPTDSERFERQLGSGPIFWQKMPPGERSSLAF
jgi:hypothetical protein